MSYLTSFLLLAPRTGCSSSGLEMKWAVNGMAGCSNHIPSSSVYITMEAAEDFLLRFMIWSEWAGDPIAFVLTPRHVASLR